MDGTAPGIASGISFNDAQLETLSAQPASELFPIFRTANVISPWFIVLSVLPLVCGVMVWTLNDPDARWALRALELAHPSTGNPVSAEISEKALGPLTAAPPLITWLTALLMHILGTDTRLSMVGVSCLAVAGTVFTAAKLAQRLGSSRLALLTACCCAGHPLFLNAAHSSGPAALGLCLMTISLERFVAHLEDSVGSWSSRLIVSGLAWGGCWLALGWPALSLGIAVLLYLWQNSYSPNSLIPTSTVTTKDLKRGVLLWWGIGLFTGSWWLWGAFRSFGVPATWAWLLDPVANPISPLFPREQRIIWWGGTVGLTFLLGWIVLGLPALFSPRGRQVLEASHGRAMLIVWWWILLIAGRFIAVGLGADPTLWDVLQIVPASFAAATGMTMVAQRRVSASGLAIGVAVGIISLFVHSISIKNRILDWSILSGAAICLVPLVATCFTMRGRAWTESQRRWALRGLVVSTVFAHMLWGVAQSFSGSNVEFRLARQLSRLKSTVPSPSAILIVNESEPSRSLEFQLRRCWPESALMLTNRWEAAVSENLSRLENWSTSEFLVVELAHRDTQFRLPGAGWIVTPVGEPRRYRGDKLTMHRVRIQSP